MQTSKNERFSFALLSYCHKYVQVMRNAIDDLNFNNDV